MIKDETVSYAFLVLLGQLSPVERAVFVLREAFSYHYGDIAMLLEKTEANCRKIYSRAKQKLPNDLHGHTENTEHVDFLAKTFIEASMTGDFEDFIDILTEDVVLVNDGGGRVISAIYPIVNKQRVSAYLKGVSARGSFHGGLFPVMVNSQKGILQTRDGHPVRVICFALDSKQKNIQSIYIVSNPEKLNHIAVSAYRID
ncbi:sigma factor-like helix-turn-helix DNA-binding protein [Gracilibacillus caseinilyticus]|uniref:sigma factor-like helix-turn-helix DNA-binding protein n=1 Tax=Gracilibacillus caseinilyticus TaxID=2932256 RepID=UPI00351088EB